jgi:hypothetical protein
MEGQFNREARAQILKGNDLPPNPEPLETLWGAYLQEAHERRPYAVPARCGLQSRQWQRRGAQKAIPIQPGRLLHSR